MANKERCIEDIFIELYCFEQLKYLEIEKELNISRSEVQQLYDSCKERISDMQIIKRKYNNKKDLEEFKFSDFKEFYNWYKRQPNNCCYCGITQEDAIKSKVYDNLKRKTRGISLEIERVITFPKKDNVYSVSNCRLACHVCNNAKSDFFTVEDFKLIAKGINNFWSNKLGKRIVFPPEVYETFNKESNDK
ncbi:hypothetical protein Arnit_1002 [Arcobacter nitrofigilis DSM 7299]|uniref:HNH domain-containing protein n=1 Tax=Arcobacter nitrofigilis (strain ATCC 33309 / DSM 7299 / CCUG 15893 / LMG 7604 / NCTC 12251 / CI) TaxID=572480 RepID=D5V383_ARCNC|nr:hypothetical protein [Arcobacter nitrofigilis]ADG92665.1 hypothetical protein Arnit_1002 [Arcobacter nitrofigilis DSM 7299]